MYLKLSICCSKKTGTRILSSLQGFVELLVPLHIVADMIYWRNILKVLRIKIKTDDIVLNLDRVVHIKVHLLDTLTKLNKISATVIL